VRHRTGPDASSLLFSLRRGSLERHCPLLALNGYKFRQPACPLMTRSSLALKWIAFAIVKLTNGLSIESLFLDLKVCAE
jgi:hypothetical protein